MYRPQQEGLYDPGNEHDACGVGFVVNIKNRKSHAIVEQGLQILKNLEHRGATGYDPLLGDGAGILIQIPDAFFREELNKQGVALPAAGEYGVGMIFLPRNSESRRACEAAIERTVRYEGQTLLGWRDVPCDNAGLARDFADNHLRVGGNFLIKLFQGVGFDDYVKDLRTRFEKVVVRKPAASRRRSNEVYALALGKRRGKN